MIGTIIGGIVTSIADNAIGKVADAFKAYQSKQISIAELEAKVKDAMLEAFAGIEKAALEALTKTWDSFMKALPKSKLMQIMWASALGSQIFVLFWYQWVVPFIVFMGWATKYPSAGSTVEWAYALIAGLLGMGPVVLRTGPGAGNIAEQLKSLVKK